MSPMLGARRSIVSLAIALLVGSPRAQGFATGLERADAEIADGEVRAALDGLFALEPLAQSDEQRGLLATRLSTVALALQQAGDPRSALPAWEMVVLLRRRLHGERDHRDVATSLNNLAACLESLGRAAEALSQHEQALAMRKRLYGDRDHVAVATSLNNVAHCLDLLGRAAEALPKFEQALAMDKRLHGDRDHPDVATGLNNVAHCLHALGRAAEALPPFQQALAMEQRLHGDRDDPDVALTLHNMAACLRSLGCAAEALPQYERALAMWKRLYGDRDHSQIAMGLSNLAVCLQSLGRAADALPRHEQASTMRRRLYGDGDHRDVAMGLNEMANCLNLLGRAAEALSQFEQAGAMLERLYADRLHPAVARNLNDVASCLKDFGRAGEALPRFEGALAMRKRLYGDRDHPEVAMSLNDVAACLQSLGRVVEALPQHEQALAMRRRMWGARDHPAVAMSLNNVACCLHSLGRAADALPLYEQALAMEKRLYADGVHPDVARSLNNVGYCLYALARVAEALPQFEQALAMWRRLYGDGDHPAVAASLSNRAACLQLLGRGAEALSQSGQALAMQRRLCGDRDHPAVATTLTNVASSLASLGREAEALSQYEQALAMDKRLYGDRDHPDVAAGLNRMASVLHAIGRPRDAVPPVVQACAMIERLRDDSRISSELRQSYFDELKRGGAFETLEHLTFRSDPTTALAAAERSRGRDLLDLFEQVSFDPLEEAESRARRRGDEEACRAIAELRADLGRIGLEDDRLLRELTRLDDALAADRDARRAAVLAESNAVAARKRQLQDERARRLGEVLPVGRVRTAAEVGAVLAAGELFLVFTLTERVALLYVLSHDREPEAVELPTAHATVRRVLPVLLQRDSKEQLRGRDPEAPQPAADGAAASRDLFASLFPAAVWQRIRSAKRVFLAAHRVLHQLPFELLVTDSQHGKPVHWLDVGPPISYVPSASALHWLRQRAKDAAGDATSLDLLAVGDPRSLEAAPEIPDRGVFVVSVDEGGEGARAGLRPGDVLTSYDGTSLDDDKALGHARLAAERAIADGKRETTSIAIELWRMGETLRVDAQPGLLGIQVGPGNARAGWEASLGGEAKAERVLRAGDIERIGSLPPLRGARAETEGIARMFADRRLPARRLLHAEATESAVFELAAKARHLHFACHGIAEEYAGQSLSMLVLSQPKHVLPGDDGLLKLGDLLQRWRGRLSSCRLVVLSACRTNVGPTFRDEAPYALPIGFLFAGAPTVISSLWPVDDSSTRELMTDFYSRLLAGETDKLAAFTAAKKALRAKYPHPFHWAPFLFLGSPE